MAKGVGLDAGGYEVKVVELDGSYKRPRLTKVSIDRVAAIDDESTEETRAQFEADAALHALRDARLSRDNVCLGFPCREAVLRDLIVPFTGQDAIRKVIKFEAEGEIHSHSVDDMVVDFRTYEERAGETRVLVAAVPKRNLDILLRALESHGIEPETVDLDTMALYRVAEWAGCFVSAESIDAAADGDDEDEADTRSLPVTSSNALEAGQRLAHLVVDVGARSTRILAVVDGELADMRALRVGVDSIIEDITAREGLDSQTAREAVFSVLQTGDDYPIRGAEPDDVDAEEGAVTAAVDGVVTRGTVEDACERLFMRLRRELLRFMTGMPQIGGIARLCVTGGGSSLPGLNAVLEDALGCRVEPLDVLANLSHNLDDEEVEWIGPRIAVAVGLALGNMGGVTGFNFRQEELAFRRKFDRVKFPLAIACMLGVFLPFIYGMRQYKKLENLERQYGSVFEVEEKSGRSGNRKNATFWGHVGFLLNRNQLGERIAQELGGRKEFDALIEQVLAKDTFDRVATVRKRLDRQRTDSQEQSGIYEDLTLPSGFYVLSQFSRLIHDNEDELASFLITELELTLPNRADSRNLTFTVAYRGDDFRERHGRLKQVIESQFGEPSSPFKGFGGRGRGETPFSAGDVTGAYYSVQVDLKESWEEEKP